MGGVWARLRKRDKGIAETKNRTDDIFLSSSFLYGLFLNFSFYGTSADTSAGIHSPVTEERVATSHPQFSTIAPGRFPSNERSTVMRMHLLGGLSSQ